MALVKTPTMFEREELVEPIFNFLVSAISMATCFYFLVLASKLFFRWEGVGAGSTDVLVIDRLLEGQVPPGIKMALTLPVQTIPMGMDISVAKRVTLANVVIVGITLQFMFLLEHPEDLHSCKDGETHNRHKIFVNDLLLAMCVLLFLTLPSSSKLASTLILLILDSNRYAVGVAYFSSAPGLQITDEFNKTLRAERLADSVSARNFLFNPSFP
jgi:hypothetical protein